VPETVVHLITKVTYLTNLNTQSYAINYISKQWRFLWTSKNAYSTIWVIV